MPARPRTVDRLLARQIQSAARSFAAIVLTGPRRAGKTTLLRDRFPQASYVLLEDPDTLARVRGDPRRFIDELEPPVILDEIQNAPELFAYVRSRIDARPRRAGQWFLTGSQESSLMRGVTESLAGRAAVFGLLPFSTEESPKVDPLHGGFPEPLARPSARGIWFSSYVLTYLERDVRAVVGVRDLSLFRRFLALTASRCGQILNRAEMAGGLGVSVPTIGEWLAVLEVTGQILLVPPYFENFGKRLIKSPKLYFSDSGLACHLLGIESEHALERSPFCGPVFESFVASEIVKSQLNRGGRRELYYFRDQQGLEVDFVVPRGAGGLALVEAKAGRTVSARDAEPMRRLAAAIGTRHALAQYVVHRPSPSAHPTQALTPVAAAVGIASLIGAIR